MGDNQEDQERYAKKIMHNFNRAYELLGNESYDVETLGLIKKEMHKPITVIDLVNIHSSIAEIALSTIGAIAELPGHNTVSRDYLKSALSGVRDLAESVGKISDLSDLIDRIEQGSLPKDHGNG